MVCLLSCITLMRDKTVEHNSWELDHESRQHVNRIMATWLPYLASMQDTMPGHACRTAACPHVLNGLTLGFSPEHQPPIQALVSVEDCLEGINYFEVPHQNTFAMLDGWLPGRFAREDVQHRIKNCCSLACGFRVNGEMFSLALVPLGIFFVAPRQLGQNLRFTFCASVWCSEDWLQLCSPMPRTLSGLSWVDTGHQHSESL